MARRLAILLMVLFVAVSFVRCDFFGEQRGSHPVQTRVMKYIKLIKSGAHDLAYNMLTEETRVAWPKAEFIEHVEEYIKPYADSYEVRTIRQNVSGRAEVDLRMTGMNAAFNNTIDVDFDPILLYDQEKQEWFIHDETKANEYALKLAEDEARKERVKQYFTGVSIEEFGFRAFKEQGEYRFAVSGTLINNGNEPIDWTRILVQFLDAQGNVIMLGNAKTGQIDGLEIAPFYPGQMGQEGMEEGEGRAEPLNQGESAKFRETISCYEEIPLSWRGKVRWEFWDGGGPLLQ